MTSQRIGKYACLEIERRYLLKTFPDDVLEAANGWLITDRYFPDTRLRLRYMKSVPGNENIYKLTQKYRSETQDPSEATITNLYLTEAEYRQLESLEGKIIRKRRYSCSLQNHNYSIDVFEGRHQGLILAEREFERQSDLGEIALPAFAFKDVTDDPFFTGGNLITVTEAEFRQGLSQRLHDHQDFSQNAA